MRRPVSSRLILAVVLLTGMQSIAQASPNGSLAHEQGVTRQAAKTLADRAANLIARGEHADAEELLRQAYDKYPAPTIAVLRARTLVRLQRLSSALSVYERAMLSSLEPDAPEAFRRAIEQAQVEATALRPRVPRLQVVVRGPTSVHPALTLTLDNRLLPTAQRGHWILVDPGQRVVRAEMDGQVSEQIVRVEERQSVVVEVSEPRAQSGLYQAISWGSLGAGVAGVSVGVVSGQIATSAHSRAERACPQERCVEGGTGAQDLERFRTHRVISTVGYALGAVGLSVGAFLLIRGTPDGPALRVELDRQSAVLHWEGVL